VADTQPLRPSQITGYQPFWSAPVTGTEVPAASRVMTVPPGVVRQFRLAPPVFITVPIVPFGVVGGGVVVPLTWR